MFKKLLLLLALTLVLVAPAGEKRIFGSKAGGNQTLMRVDIVTKIIEYTMNGTDWIQPLLAEATTSSAGLMSASDKSKMNMVPASLGTSGQVWTVNSGATAAEWTTPSASSGIDLSSYGASYDTHFLRFGYSDGGVDSYVKLLIHADGTNGETSFIDSSSTGRTISTSGTVSKSTSYYKFGTASANFGGGHLALAPDSGLDFGSENFTIDFWMYPTSDSSRQCIYFNAVDLYGVGIEFCFNGTRNIALWATTNNSGWDILQSDTSGQANSGIGSASIPLYQWSHVGLVRSGNTWMLFINGTLDISRTRSGTVSDSGDYKYIGVGPSRSNFNGYIDEFRISKGIARWTADFTPPASAYSSEVSRTVYVDSSALSNATTSSAGLMSASDKTKLDSLYTSVTINAQTASYTLVLSDKSKLITMSNASANTLTIPLNSSVAFPVGTWIDVSNIGAGTCTITAASGVTLNGTDAGTKDLAQWGGARLYKIAENTWITR